MSKGRVKQIVFIYVTSVASICQVTSNSSTVIFAAIIAQLTATATASTYFGAGCSFLSLHLSFSLRFIFLILFSLQCLCLRNGMDPERGVNGTDQGQDRLRPAGKESGRNTGSRNGRPIDCALSATTVPYVTAGVPWSVQEAPGSHQNSDDWKGNSFSWGRSVLLYFHNFINIISRKKKKERRRLTMTLGRKKKTKKIFMSLSWNAYLDCCSEVQIFILTSPFLCHRLAAEPRIV